MRSPSNEEIVDLLLRVMTDGFNRSLGALSDAGAVDTKKLRSQYRGVGSKYYDLVTEQMMTTARSFAAGVRHLYEDDGQPPASKPESA